MPELIYYVAASVDGYIATPDGGVEWLNDFGAHGEDYGFREFYASVQAAWQGRFTYQKCLEFGEWPYAGKESLVFTHAPLISERRDVRFTAETPADEMRRATREESTVSGSWAAAGSQRRAAKRGSSASTSSR
jgi:dihydrofolate reductase